MKVNLISFQDKAVKELRMDIADALEAYRRRKKTQVVSLQAPTGAGKTIIAAALILALFLFASLVCCGKQKTVHCDRCGKELHVSADSNVDESWILYCSDCEKELGLDTLGR